LRSRTIKCIGVVFVDEDLSDKVESISGRIIRVQPSILAVGPASSSYSHEIIYLIVKTQQGDHKTLIYPYTCAFREGNATIQYNPLPQGEISTARLVELFVSKHVSTTQVLNILADGIVVSRGVTYEQE
jgi:hypothetical protein